MGRRGASRAIAALAVASAALATLAGCGSDDSDGGSGRGQGAVGREQAEVADTVCTLLRGWNNDLGGVINATSQTITDEDDPGTANGVLLAGFDDMIAAAETHVAEAEDLELPDVPGSSHLVTELRSGAEESLAVLRDERADAAALAPIDVAGQGGALGGAFTAVERATSVLEPRIGAYDEELQRAFAADEGCAHVVQPPG